MTGSLTLCAELASELPEATKGGAPDWIELFRPGLNVARDGRRFTLDNPQAVIAASMKDGAELPVDYEHQTERKGTTGPVPAAGWITELAERAGGIWAKVSWTTDAARMIGKREYRFISPAMYTSASGVIRSIKGAGLVHWPALNLTQLASRKDPMSEQDTETVSFTKSELADLLGLEADAVTASALKDRLTTAAPDPARFVPIDAVKELLASRNEARQALSVTEARMKVELAHDAGHLTPAMVPWAVELCQSDPEAFDDFVAASPAPYAYMFAGSQTERARRSEAGLKGRETRAHDEATLSVCRQLGIDPEALNT